MLIYDSTNIPEAVGRGTLDPELEAWLPSGPTLGADVPIAQGRRDHVQLGVGPWPPIGAVDTLVLPGPHGSCAEVGPPLVVQTHELAVEDHRPAAKDVFDLHELGKLIGAVATGP